MKITLVSILLTLTMSCTLLGIRKEETPKYKVLKKENNFELREYESFILAQVEQKGEFQQSAKDSFRVLAGYIFGDNKQNKKMAMTAPVGEALNNPSENINLMTEEQMKFQTWKVTFVMPSKFKKSDLPVPNNSRVKIVEEKKGQFAVLTFKGTTPNKKLISKLKELNSWINKNNLESTQIFWVWRYDPPWTLPFFRRNEVAIQIKSK